jgi:hypothetical protein
MVVSNDNLHAQYISNKEIALSPAQTTTIAYVIPCKFCIHRPVYENGKVAAPRYEDSAFRDYTCPYICDDSYYNRMPSDGNFCFNGECKKEVD